MGTYSRLVSPVFPHFDIVSQSRTALDVDANSCGSFDCATFVVPIWTRKWLRRPECHDVPSVRPGILRRYENVNQELRWLGQNSKQNKLSRALGDVQIRMRLKVSGNKSEIRLSYLPAMFPLVVKPLMEQGSVRSSRFSAHKPVN